MARITIVDEQDNILAHKEKHELQHGEIFRAASLWITDPDGNILLARRSMTKSNNPGKWGTAVAGHVDEGEDYAEAIKREAYEEIGLKHVNPIPFKKFFRTEKDRFFSQWFTTIIPQDTEFTIDHSEVAEVRWWTREELMRAIAEHPDEFIPSARYWLEHI
jgi:isopentenyldiphosphate isomerase